MSNFKSQISGHLDILVLDNQDELNGETVHWKEVLIHGDPDGLRSLANLLLKLADLNQDSVEGLPIGAREHFHLRPKFELSKSSLETIVGRLDAKGTGHFYDSFISKDTSS